MRELPILMNCAMVRAILDGRKTVTRRVVKVRGQMPPAWATFAQEGHILSVAGPSRPSGLFRWSEEQTPGQPLKPLRRWPTHAERHPLAGLDYHAQPPYQVGDRLYVRETFSIETGIADGLPPHQDGRPILRRPADDVDCVMPIWEQAHYRATDPEPDLCCFEKRCAQCRDNDMGPHWRSSIHMPKWAARIWLEVTDVRVERLQAITEDQAEAEGVAPRFLGEDDVVRYQPRYVNGFRMLWDDLAKDGTSWADNPWVWVAEFRRVEVANG